MGERISTAGAAKVAVGRQAVLVVDDEMHFLTSIRFILAHMGISDVDTCCDSRKVLAMLANKKYDAVLLDISMPFISGIQLLGQIHEIVPDVPVVMITAVNEVETAVTCIKTGAFDYLLKPIEEERLATTLNNVFQLSETRRENMMLRDSLTSGVLKQPDIFSGIETQNNAMIGVFSYIEAIAPGRQPVLITGETGTGKELAAKALHGAGNRTGGFVALNTAGISENLIDDALFGHDRGAFTGAHSERGGMVEKAAGGTLFLDEIGDLPMSIQVKLLRLIQEGTYQRIGSDDIRTTDARIVAATNHVIEDRVKKGHFRADLYYRLSTHRIRLPPLRERKDDIPCLVDKFLECAAQETQKKKPVTPAQLYTLLNTYDFPGNVRELQSMIYDAVSLHSTGVLSMSSFRKKISMQDHSECVTLDNSVGNNDKKVHFPGSLPTLKEVQALLIQEALKAADGNQTIAAGILGMTRRALNSRLSRQ